MKNMDLHLIEEFQASMHDTCHVLDVVSILAFERKMALRLATSSRTGWRSVVWTWPM